MKRGIVVPLVVSVVAVLASGTRAEEPSEYRVKASFIYNFLQFVDWPQRPGSLSQRPMLICMIGDDPFGDSLDQIVEGKVVHGRVLRVYRVRKAADARTCEVAFVSSSEKDRLRAILEELRGWSVLTVGDTRGFAEMGGVINFFLRNRHVHFEINVGAAKTAGLRISSKLLSLAKIVSSEAPRGKG